MTPRQWSLRALLWLTTLVAVVAAIGSQQAGHLGVAASYVFAGVMIASAVLAALGLPTLILAFAVSVLWRRALPRRSQQTQGRQAPVDDRGSMR